VGARLDAHDLDALLSHFSPDVVFTSPVAAQPRVRVPDTFDCALVVTGQATYETDAAAAASALPPAR
jgi:hypothetical protein